MYNNSYDGKTVLVTGHTGFKGAWLTAWLNTMGANVIGVSFDEDSKPFPPALDHLVSKQYHLDLCNPNNAHSVIAETEPDLIFHLAAQSLVRKSYVKPFETWDVNVMGSLNVLEGARKSRKPLGIILATTDKVYKNNESGNPFKESDPLGGHDPYSASKAAMEILIDSYRLAYKQPENDWETIICSARAGNVIGGGDWNEDRLIPDLIRSHKSKTPFALRNPKSVRPWQYVLDCLSGYLSLGEKVLSRESSCNGAWNFGPSLDDLMTVEEVVVFTQPHLNVEISKSLQGTLHHEAGLLTLNSDKSGKELAWSPVLNSKQALIETIDWYLEQTVLGKDNMFQFLHRYFNLAASRNAEWLR